MKWGLVCKPGAKNTVSLAKDVYDFLKENGEVFAEKNFAKEMNLKGYSLEEINKKSDVVVVIGGDGTILWTLQAVEKPIFAINSGGMGFLAEVESKYAIGGLKQVIEGKYNIEERAKLKITVDGKRLPDATNEVTVQTARISKIMYLQLFVEGELFETLGADGIIIATPTGSTSYALSVGGPIMDPSVNAMVIAPLAPFRLSARPWVVPLEKKISVKILPQTKESKLVIDGNYSQNVTTDDDIVVTGSEKKANFVRFGESFYQMVRLKLVR
ncbi:MAG: NAD(+)/NADH kinase [Candidatus Thermoplasmatota archaeon]|jgi:NAD+ kinase|nr:NAD(+)/NADH kinase [Candidatus Thermoplasmatota archaeon]